MVQILQDMVTGRKMADVLTFNALQYYLKPRYELN